MGSPKEIVIYELEALRNKLRTELDLPHTPSLILTNDFVHYFALQVRNQSDKIKYPHTYIIPRSVNENTQGYPGSRLAKSPYGKLYGRDEQGSLVSLRLQPVTIPVEFFYVTDNPIDFLVLASKWQDLSKSGALNSQIEYMGNNIDILCLPEPNISVPEKDMSMDTLDYAVTSATVNILGYTNRFSRAEDPDTTILEQKGMKFGVKPPNYSE